jgi:hypothetical protein
MSTTQPSQNPKPVEEEPKTLEDVIKEMKKMKEIIAVYKNDITMLKVDKQAKDWKIGFYDMRLKLQDEQIADLKKAVKELKKENEEMKQYLQNEETENKRRHQKAREQLINYQDMKYEETPIVEDEKIKFEFKKDITSNAPTYCSATQMFCAFKSLKGDSLSAWVTKDNTIELYDLEKDALIKSVKDAHVKDIHSCRHFVDIKNNKDLLITCSYDKSIKVWDIENLEKPLIDIQNAHSNGFIFTSCILSNEKMPENYIISGADDENIKIFDFNGKFLDKSVKVSDYVNLLDVYYYKREKKFCIINANSHDIRIYSFDDLKIYKTYIEKNSSSHAHVIVYEDEKEDKVLLIDSDMKGFIHIWDFDTEECLKTIFLQTIINGICFWNEQYIACTGRDKKIKIVDIKEAKIVRLITGHEKETISVQKVNIPKYGDCLVTHGKDGFLKVWSFNN